MEATECGIRVVARFRPVDAREAREGNKAASPVSFPPDVSVVHIADPRNKREPLTFMLDRVFEHASQADIYTIGVKDTIENVLLGFNGTIFAYGQTGSGKTHTMMGPDLNHLDHCGIIPRACRHIFDHIRDDTRGTEYTLKASFMEIYMENVRDLLQPRGGNLRVRETPAKGVWVQDLSEHYVARIEDIFDLLSAGNVNRSVSSTAMNDTSSRSHSLFMFHVTQKMSDGSVRTSRLNLADLAGSEKVGKTGATGSTLQEAKKINQSLSCLGQCINKLSKGNRGHVPYRDSKLTFILRDSLGGNTKTTLVVTCSPHIFNVEETISTLRFAQRAKTITNKVSVNQKKSVEELEALVSVLSKKLKQSRLYATALETELKRVHGPDWDPFVELKESISSLSSSGQSVAAASPTSHSSSPPVSPLASSGGHESTDADDVRKRMVEQRVREELGEELAALRYDLEQRQARLQEAHAEKLELQQQLRDNKAHVSALEEAALHAKSAMEEMDALRAAVEQQRAEAQRAREAATDSQARIVALEQWQDRALAAESKVDAFLAAQARQRALLDTFSHAKRAPRPNKGKRGSLSTTAAAASASTADDAHGPSSQRIRVPVMGLDAEGATGDGIGVRGQGDDREGVKGIEGDNGEVDESQVEVVEASRAAAGDFVGDGDVVDGGGDDFVCASDLEARLLTLQEEQAAEWEAREADHVATVERLHQRLAAVRADLAAEREASTALEKDLRTQLRDLNVKLREAKSAAQVADFKSVDSMGEVAALKSLIAERDVEVAQLQQDVQSALELCRVNAERFEAELSSREMQHKKREERRKAVIVKAITGRSTRTDTGVSPFRLSGRMPLLKDLGTALHCGTLKKQSAFWRSWRTRWFVLVAGALYWAESEASERTRGVIQLQADCVVHVGNDTRDDFVFGIYHTTGRQYLLQASSVMERNDWMRAITSMVRDLAWDVMEDDSQPQRVGGDSGEGSRPNSDIDVADQ